MKDNLKFAGAMAAFLVLCWFVGQHWGNGAAEHKREQDEQIENARVAVIDMQQEYDRENAQPAVFSKNERLDAWQNLRYAQKNYADVVARIAAERSQEKR